MEYFYVAINYLHSFNKIFVLFYFFTLKKMEGLRLSDPLTSNFAIILLTREHIELFVLDFIKRGIVGKFLVTQIKKNITTTSPNPTSSRDTSQCFS